MGIGGLERRRTDTDTLRVATARSLGYRELVLRYG
jgi:hypothetical protein